MDDYTRMKELIAKMTLRSSYWGYLFARVRRVPSIQVPFMGVKPEKDGTISLAYNPDVLRETEDKSVELALEHEGMHLLNKHIPRLIRIINNEFDDYVKNLKMQIWNIAADSAVNVQMGMPEEITVSGKPWKVHLPEHYNLPRHKIAEYYYNRLLDQQKNSNCSCGKQKCQGGDQCEGTPEQPGDHSGWEEGLEGVADLAAVARKVDNYVADIVKDSLKSFSNKRGNLPSYLSELIDGVLQPPQVPYYQMIRQLVRASRLSRFKRSPTRINRKRTYLFGINDQNLPALSPFPGRIRDYSFNISVVLDTSGSMSKDDIMEGLSGIKHIVEKDKDCTTTVIENDTEIKKEYVVKKIRDIEYEVKGRGGTTLRPALERCREIRTDVTLVFTDGGCDDINSVPKKFLPRKIIWIVTKDGTVDCINRTGFIVRLPK